MPVLRPRHTKQEFARRGEELFERDVRPRLLPDDTGKFVAIDIESGAFEMDRDDRAATDRLLSRVPDAQIWLSRVGHGATYRLGDVRSRTERDDLGPRECEPGGDRTPLRA
jgi:hypothetical protein